MGRASLPSRALPSLSPSLASRLSPVPRFKSPCSPLSLGKDCGGGRRENQLITPRLEKIGSFLSVE